VNDIIIDKDSPRWAAFQIAEDVTGRSRAAGASEATLR
jgi:hypothetical protein